MIKAIVFDFGGVVVPGVILQWVKKLPKDHPKYVLFLEKSHQWDLGELTVDEFYTALSEITNLSVENIKSKFYKEASVYPEVIEIIKKLKKHYTIALFTNNFAYSLDQYLDTLHIRDLFDKLIVSSEHKIKKPNPDFYKKLLEILNVKPHEIIFIDDTKGHVDAGNALGIASLHFTNAQQLIKDLKDKGVTV